MSRTTALALVLVAVTGCAGTAREKQAPADSSKTKVLGRDSVRRDSIVGIKMPDAKKP